MNIKKNDTVVVISGADRGKSGKVLRAIPQLSTVIVEGVNIRKRHQRPTKSNQKGQVIEKTMPIQVSNVALVDPGDGKATRVGKKLVGERFVRVSRRTGATL